MPADSIWPDVTLKGLKCVREATHAALGTTSADLRVYLCPRSRSRCVQPRSPGASHPAWARAGAPRPWHHHCWRTNPKHRRERHTSHAAMKLPLAGQGTNGSFTPGFTGTSLLLLHPQPASRERGGRAGLAAALCTDVRLSPASNKGWHRLLTAQHPNRSCPAAAFPPRDGKVNGLLNSSNCL